MGAILQRAYVVAFACVASCGGSAPHPEASLPEPIPPPGPSRGALDAGVSEPPKAVTKRVLGETVSDGARNERLRVVLGACDGSGCTLEVQLVNGEQVLGSHGLEWRVPLGEPALGPIDESMGIGDPLAPDVISQAYTIGEQSAAVTTFVQPLRLGSGRSALFVHQAAGYEHVKRSRHLFVAANGALGLAWSHQEAQGPEHTTLEVVDVDADGDDEFRFWTFSGGDDLVVDSITMETLAWNAEHRAFETAMPARPNRVFALLVGDFASETAARQAFETKSAECSSWILLGAQALTGQPHKYRFGAVTAHRDLGVRALENAKRCAPRLQSRLLEAALAQAISGSE